MPKWQPVVVGFSYALPFMAFAGWPYAVAVFAVSHQRLQSVGGVLLTGGFEQGGDIGLHHLAHGIAGQFRDDLQQ